MSKDYFHLKTAVHAGLYSQGFIDPSVLFQGTCTIGHGVVIEKDCIIGDGVFLGHNCAIRPGNVLAPHSEVRCFGWLAEGCRVGHHSVVYNYANLSAGTVLGDYVYFGSKSITTNANDIVLHRGRPFVPNPVYVEAGARIATSVTILPGITIGTNSLIGAGSLVTKNVGTREVWYGSPAKHVGMVDPHDVPSAWINGGG